MQIGLLFDPEATPAEVAHHLDATLSAVLSAELGDTHDWQIRAVKERLPPADTQSGGILGHARGRKNEEGWDLALCITDTPLRDGNHARSRRTLRRYRYNHDSTSLVRLGLSDLRVLQLINDGYDVPVPSDLQERVRRQGVEPRTR